VTFCKQNLKELQRQFFCDNDERLGALVDAMAPARRKQEAVGGTHTTR
jgi:hypothetical protein